ncbi:MAG: amidophosphoribosyltransferase [Defluviitaleaceae bacterium]|nr:amidophosphoribosyltransferase [Defluviitaleaceae bacterium]
MESTYFLDTKMNEECGVFGVFNSQNTAELTYYGLHALQHRGQESAGIVTVDKNDFNSYKGEGLVRNIFTHTAMQKLVGTHGIGHVRYSTTGGSNIENVQPFLFRGLDETFALCHNGNIVNSNEVRRYLERIGSIMQTTSDSELLGHLLKREKGSMLTRLKQSLCYLEGAFAFLLATADALYVARDKLGLRPLSIGVLENGGYVITSETCALDAVGATFMRNVNPGEVLQIDQNGIVTDSYAKETRHKMCAMEYIYFARPDSDIEEVNVHEARKRCGMMLAEQAPAPTADIVIGVPDSGLSAAIGYAETAGLPFETGMVKNRYIGRTFIEPSQALREQGVKMKLSVVAKVVQNKSVVLIDDSIVRGTTSRNLITMLKKAGAKEVHMRIAGPEIKFPCFYGVDFSTYDELISARSTVGEIRQLIGADSLGFLNIENLAKGVKMKNNCGLCTACFSGDYPTNLYERLEDMNKDVK